MIYTLQQFSKKTCLSELNCKLFFTRILKKVKTEYQYIFDENDFEVFKSLQFEAFSKLHNIKQIQEFLPDIFYIEDTGNVYSYKLGYMQKIVPYNEKRYCIKNNNSYIYVDELVAKYFLSNENNYSSVIHLNGNIFDDRASNLKYVSKEEYNKYQQELVNQYLKMMPQEKIRIGKFMKLAGVSRKTAYWLWKNTFYPHVATGKFKHQYFSQSNVNHILSLKIENYSKHHNIKLIEGSKDTYIEDTGDIFSYKRNFLEKRSQGISHGYRYISIKINGKGKDFRVHRLVAEYFLPPRDKSFDVVNHKDGNKENNDVSNLEWSSASLNAIHAYNHGLNKTTKGKSIAKHPIDIYDKNKNLLYEFKTMQEASNITKIPCTTLRNLAKNKNFSPKFQVYVRNHGIPV